MSSPVLRSVAVYCGSSLGLDPAFAEAARSLGGLLASRGCRLVYGGGHVGLMGAVADGALAGGGEVVGVITEALAERELSHAGLGSLEVVATMHERKARMADLSDGVIMLPGGFGTLDEFFEAVTWTQLGVHATPCGILDVGGYYAPLLGFLDAAVDAGFVAARHREMIVTSTDPIDLLDRLGQLRFVGEGLLSDDQR
jgi:uncharacterized protein (TIGR00730 family)